MSIEGQKRAKIMEMVKAKKIKQREAADLIGVSYRQVKRIFKEYRDKGDEALNHGLIDKSGNHRIDEEEKEKIIRIVEEDFKGYKPTFISEKLLECYDIKIRSNTLRIWMIEEGLWKKSKKMSKHRTRRQRKEHFGEMIQMDGSPHDWFGTDEEYCLMHMIDDATNTAYGLFDTGETTEIALRALFDWIKKYGIPQSIYTDHGSVFKVEREPWLEEQMKGVEPRTRFGQVCADLGIEIIYANSPQAKGRVERANGIQQDRLISEMKFHGIEGVEIANNFLKKEYWDKHNLKYSKPSLSNENYHIELLKDQDLRNLICYKDYRKVSHDFVISLNNRLFQILREQKIDVRPGDEVMIKTWMDGSVHIFKKDIELLYHEIFGQTKKRIA